MNERAVQPTPRAGAVPRDEIEEYSPERIAEFLLNNTVDAVGYASACAEVRALGLDPARIPHIKPAGA